MPERRTIAFLLNGRRVTADIGVHEDAVEVLQREFDLFGARVSCGQGLCGCCTIAVDGKTVSGCLYLAASLDGTSVETVESLGSDGAHLHPIQRAFIEASGFQCGFCTPGFIMMTRELLSKNPHPSPEEIKEYLSGNLCRCAAYPDILQAVQLAADASVRATA